MMKVLDLKPGMLVTNAGVSATFVNMAPHPLYRGLMMVIWVMDDSHPGFGSRFGRVSLDALHPGQDVGGVDPALNSDEQCFDRLRETLKAVD